MILPNFEDKVRENNNSFYRNKLKTLQINIGKVCNLACHHCHVESGPLRTENMNAKTAVRLVHLIHKSKDIQTVDLTGGAPELNEHFRMIVANSCDAKKEVIVRSNITVLFEKGQEDTAEFFQKQKVRVVASLPCYSKENVEKQRGKGVFDKSVEGLKILNELGYGKENTGLFLDLVFNPLGATLPPNQEKLEIDYKRELKKIFDIDFNKLYTITNMPIKRFLSDLMRQGKREEYMMILVNNFNPMTLNDVMCKNLLSVSFDGKLFDCDFNQMLEMPIDNIAKSIWDIDSFDSFSENIKIKTANHCFACTAGAGSSCGGALKS
jgi:radical SAM/Cys-rich protein